MYTHLHCHSYFSFSAGTIPAVELPLLAKNAGMTALALTDTNNMSGALQFYFAARKAGIKPILGVELKTRHERAVLLAKNNAGYKEICETLSRVLEGIPQTKPKLTLEDVGIKEVPMVSDDNYYSLAPYLLGLSDNVYTLSSSPAVLSALASANVPNLYMEIILSERKEWPVLRELFQHLSIPIVASNDVFLQSESDFELHELLRAIGTNTTLHNTPVYELAQPSQWFMDERTFREYTKGIDETAFQNIERIAKTCEVEFDTSYNKFARYPCDDPFARLKSLAEKGFERRYSSPTPEHRSRFEYELRTIEGLGATSYFLAVHDMIMFARSKNFPYLGRGSGANSLIAYCLEISNVDPVVNTLRFERFLNPERTSAPDFDIDFSWKNRYEVINYMLDKFGRENSAMLCTIQCYRERGGIREVGKALGFSDAEINELGSNVRAVARTGNVNGFHKREGYLQDVENWLRWSERLQGFPRHLSVHAGGIVIGDKPLSHYTPVQNAPIGVPITHIDMFSAEDIRLIKLDVLSTRGLGTYWDTMALVEKRYGFRPPVENEQIAFNDEPTRELIRTGKTKGCFYIESPAMISLLRKLRTDTFQNLTAASSVIRPGVSQSGMMDEYIYRSHFVRKFGKPFRFTKEYFIALLKDYAIRIKKITNELKLAAAKPILPLLELLPETFGIIVYQEDVLTVVHLYAGLSLAKADVFRRSLSGKLRSFESIARMKYDFIEGALLNGHPNEEAEEVWRQVSSFGGYSFCKAHSASYAVLSFQEAWLKVHYPAEFLCSVLNNFGGFYNHQEYVNEAKALGIVVKLPDVNGSEIVHTVGDDEDGKPFIRLGLIAFSNVSLQSLVIVLENRERGGRYTSIEDFAIRSGVTQEDGMTLIKLGACESIESNRAISAMKFGLLVRQANRKSLQNTLEFPMELMSYNFEHLTEPDALTIFHRERKYFGYSVTNRPTDFLPLDDQNRVRAIELKSYTGKRITIVGFRSASKGVTTKTGKPMLMLNISDDTGMMDVVVWSDVYVRYYSELSTGQAFRITGKVEMSFDVPSLHAERIESVGFAIPTSNGSLRSQVINTLSEVYSDRDLNLP